MAGWWDEAKTSGGMRDLKSLSCTLLFGTTYFHYGRLDDRVPAAVRQMSGSGNQAQIYAGRVMIIFKQENSSLFLERGVILQMHKSFNEKIAYRKIPITSPGLIFVKSLFCWAYFRGSLFSEGLIIGRKFAFQNGLGLTIKTT